MQINNVMLIHLFILQSLLLSVFSDNNAVPGPAFGHSLLCVDPLHKPVPGQRCAADRLWRKRESSAETRRANGSIQKPSESVVGLFAHVSRDTNDRSEVSVDLSVADLIQHRVEGPDVEVLHSSF